MQDRTEQGIKALDALHELDARAAGLEDDHGENGNAVNAVNALNGSTWPEPLDLEALAERQPQPPQFIVNDWLPVGYGTLLAGHGGVGKSAIGLHLIVCVALGLPFCGMHVQRRRVVYLSCEDREDIIHWRLARICAHLSIDMAGLHGNLDIRDLVGHETVLWEKDPRTGYTLTPPYGQLAGIMGREAAPELLVIDGVSDTFGGGELSRTDTKRYVNSLVRLINPARGAVLLIGHVNKVSASAPATSEGYSGTTGWHNAVRARWYLYPETDGTEDSRPGMVARTGALMLELQKSNHGPMDQALKWQWDDDAHMFLPEAGLTTFDKAHQGREMRRAILLTMLACHQSSIAVPAATTGQRTAFHVLSAQKNWPQNVGRGRSQTRQFWRQIEEMRASALIADNEIRRKDRHYVACISLTEQGMRACGE